MNRILYFKLFVCFVQVQCENLKNEGENSLSNAKLINKLNRANIEKNLVMDSSEMISETIPVDQMTTFKMRKSRDIKKDQLLEENNIDEENATFDPNTILIDRKKVKENVKKMKSIANVLHGNNESIISMDEAMKIQNHDPVKPIKYDFNLPDVPYNVEIPPHGKIAKDGELDMESRKLFVRPPNFPTQSTPLNVKKKTMNKTVKKDLSRMNH